MTLVSYISPGDNNGTDLKEPDNKDWEGRERPDDIVYWLLLRISWLWEHRVIENPLMVQILTYPFFSHRKPLTPQHPTKRVKAEFF